MPITQNQTPVSVQDLKTILASQKINQGDIQNAINAINPKPSATVSITTTPLSNASTTTTVPSGFFSSLERAFTGLSTGTTQAQAVLQTTANLTPLATEPVPPAFLTKLYNLKHGQDADQHHASSADKYIQQMMSGMGGSNISSRSGGYQRPGNQYSSQVSSMPDGMYSYQYRPNYLPNGRDGGYTQNDALPVFNVTNPQTTYAAFSGPASNPSTTRASLDNPNNLPTFANGQIMTPDDIAMEKAFQLRDSLYQQHSTTTTTTANTTTTTTARAGARAGFANVGMGVSMSKAANSQVISTEQTVATKIKNDTKNVEKIAIGFITILVIIFLIAVITYVKNAKSS
jgi:hypothetical protein